MEQILGWVAQRGPASNCPPEREAVHQEEAWMNLALFNHQEARALKGQTGTPRPPPPFQGPRLSPLAPAG